MRSTTQIWVETRHRYGISALVSHTSFDGETNGSVATCRLFSQASVTGACKVVPFSSVAVQGIEYLSMRFCSEMNR